MPVRTRSPDEGHYTPGSHADGRRNRGEFAFEKRAYARGGAIVRAHNLFWGAAIVVLAVATMIAFVWKGWHSRQLALRLEQLRAERRELLDEQDKLRARATALSHAARIKDIVSERLGLVEPTTPPIDVPAIGSLGSPDSLAECRATGTEILRAMRSRSSSGQ